MTILNIKNVKKHYGDVEVLHNINVTVEQGELLVLLGPSGCGKSTLLNTIAGLEDITSGEIIIAGRDVSSIPPKDRDIAMVFQSYALYPNMNVRQNITFGMKVRGVPKAEQKRLLMEATTTLKIENLLNRKPGQLSGGQRQRVAMGRALVRNPTLFLFDEPLSNLDAKLRVEMRAEIKKLHKAMNASIVYVTHDQVEAMSLGTKVALMYDGWIQQFGTPEQLYDQPINLFVAKFIGAPTSNILEGHLTANGKKVIFNYQNEGKTIALDVSHYAFKHPPVDGKKVILTIRPEYIKERQVEGSVKVRFVVESFETNGFDRFATGTHAGRVFTARFTPRQQVEYGKKVTAYMRLEKVSLFDPETEDRL